MPWMDGPRPITCLDSCRFVAPLPADLEPLQYAIETSQDTAAAQSTSDPDSVHNMVAHVTPAPMNELAVTIFTTNDHIMQLQSKTMQEDEFYEKKTLKQKLLLGILYTGVSLALLHLVVVAIQFIGDFFVLMLVVTRWMPPLRYD